MSSFVTGIVIDKIKNGIENHANMNGLTKYDLYVMIRPEDEEFTPGFVLCNRTKPIKEISFKDFVGISKILGFDVAGEGEKWIKKFLLMSAADNEIDFYDSHFYFIRIKVDEQSGDDKLQAWMYRDNAPFKEISIEYIMTTS